MRKLKYILEDLRWLKVLNSPFKPFSVKFYAGKTRIGMPYFYPRKWVKGTPKLITEAVLREIESEKRYNKLNPDSARKIKSFEELYEERKNYLFAVPLKVGFSYCSLGWKTKFGDFRYEWGPILSFVFFGYQIALMVGFRDRDGVGAYWESWLYYEYRTDKTKSKRERIEQCRKEAPQTWSRYNKDGTKTTTDYYEHILKLKYL
jgi:hypothetical protein